MLARKLHKLPHGAGRIRLCARIPQTTVHFMGQCPAKFLYAVLGSDVATIQSGLSDLDSVHKLIADCTRDYDLTVKRLEHVTDPLEQLALQQRLDMLRLARTESLMHEIANEQTRISGRMHALGVSNPNAKANTRRMDQLREATNEIRRAHVTLDNILTEPVPPAVLPDAPTHTPETLRQRTVADVPIPS